MMASNFADLNKVLKQVYPAGPTFGKMLNQQSVFHKYVSGTSWSIGSSWEVRQMEESLWGQMAALLGEPVLACEDGEQDTMDALAWMRDAFDGVKRTRLNPERLDAWRDGKLEEYEASLAPRRVPRGRQKGPRAPHDPPAKRTPIKARQPRSRPRGRARSSC